MIIVKTLKQLLGAVILGCFSLAAYGLSAQDRIVVLFPGFEKSLQNPAGTQTETGNTCGGSCGQTFKIPVYTGPDYNGPCPGPGTIMVQCATVQTDVCSLRDFNNNGNQCPSGSAKAIWTIDKPRQCLSSNGLFFLLHSNNADLSVTYSLNFGDVTYKLSSLPSGTTSCSGSIVDNLFLCS